MYNRYSSIVDINSNIEEKIDKYTNRDNILPTITNYKITRLNIDSRFRVINPCNIINKYIKLEDNSFIFEKNSYILKIIIPKNTNIKLDDYITISNIKSHNIIIPANNLILNKNSKLIQINHINHQFEENKNYIKISNVKTSNNFINNLPLTLINNIHKVILTTNNNIINPNSYFIEVNMMAEEDYIYNDNFNIEILTLNGINTKYILANYPIDDNVYQGYHNVIETGTYLKSDYIKIELKDYATSSGIYNSSGVEIGIIDNIINGYPEPNNYKIKFNKPFNKLKKIKLVNTIFPNSQLLINNKNNSLYWQILDDGEYIYKIEILPGNYNLESLELILTKSINILYRKFGDYLQNDSFNYYQNCISKIILDKSNNIFSMQLFSKIYLTNSISIDNKIYDDKYIRLIISHKYHNLDVGDAIIISNSNDISYIPANIINDTHIVEYVYNINSYRIKLKKFNNINNINNNDNNIEILYPINFRLLFNYDNTIGNILGFKYTGNVNSITNFKKIITNNDNSILINSVGIALPNNSIFNFITYPYILMASSNFNSNINIKDSIGIFAKILLPGNLGSYIYDQYVQIIEDIPESYSNMYEIEFQFLTPDGKLYNFNGIEHSYTLEFYEEIH